MDETSLEAIDPIEDAPHKEDGTTALSSTSDMPHLGNGPGLDPSLGAGGPITAGRAERGGCRSRPVDDTEYAVRAHIHEGGMMREFYVIGGCGMREACDGALPG